MKVPQFSTALVILLDTDALLILEAFNDGVLRQRSIET